MSDSPQSCKKPRTRKETIQKRETRSKHEKRRREEMNEVICEMSTLLPEDIRAHKLRRVDQKPRQLDKCFIIGSTVDIIRNSDYKPPLLSDPLVQDIFSLTNCFMVFLNNFIVVDIKGDHQAVFDIEKKRMIGKDIRCFLDYDSTSKLSFLTSKEMLNELQLKSFMAKSMTCRIKESAEKPTETVLVCVPDELPALPVTVPKAPHILAPPLQKTPPPPSSLEVKSPILAALLRRKEDNCVKVSSPSSFCSPGSSTSSTVPNVKPTVTRRPTVPTKRKRLRSMNVIVESYPLDDEKSDGNSQKSAKIGKKSQTSTIPTPRSTLSPTAVIQPSTSLIQPIPTLGMNPFDMLSPGYQDIWLRLQSERLLLEKRISAKEGELKNLMQFVQNPPFLNFPQYMLPQGPLGAQNQ